MDIRVFDGSEARLIDQDGIQWPDGSTVLYAFEDNKIVGRQGYLFLPHLEGAWVAEEKRGSNLALKLITKMENLVATEGFPAIFAYSYDAQPEIGEYLERIDYEKLPISLWMKRLEKPKEV